MFLTTGLLKSGKKKKKQNRKNTLRQGTYTAVSCWALGQSFELTLKPGLQHIQVENLEAWSWSPDAEHKWSSWLCKRSSLGRVKAQVAVLTVVLPAEGLWGASSSLLSTRVPMDGPIERLVAEAQNRSRLAVVPCRWWKSSSTFNMQCIEDKMGLYLFSLWRFSLWVFFYSSVCNCSHSARHVLVKYLLKN